MANYYASARSNYFKVTDEKAFKDFCSKVGLGVWDSSKEDHTLYAIYPQNDDGGGWDLDLNVLDYQSEQEGEDSEPHGDLIEELSKYLADDEVCIIQEVGAEKLRYLNAYAICFNNKGERETLDLSSLAFEAAAELTSKPENLTEAQY